MKANELMIDDWVYLVKDYGRPKKNIMKIDALDLQRISDGMFEVEPIPITPEILEKNGFELHPDGWLWCKEKGNEEQNYIFIQFRKGCDEIRLCELNFTNKVVAKHSSIANVHELQHFFKVCAIEKEIEL